jgi:4-hydroxy-3-methylbut-2-enyl diphosphate reductase
VSLEVLCPLWIEARAARGRVVGMGPERARSARVTGDAIAVAGFCGGVDPSLRPGDVVLATELRSGDGVLPCPGSARLAGPLRDLGLRVTTGAVHSAASIVGPEERDRLRETGVLAVDMESYWLAVAAEERPLAVLRVVVDEAGRRLLHPRTLPAGIRAFRTLRRAASTLPGWGSTAASAGGAEPLRFALPTEVR